MISESHLGAGREVDVDGLSVEDQSLTLYAVASDVDDSTEVSPGPVPERGSEDTVQKPPDFVLGGRTRPVAAPSPFRYGVHEVAVEDFVLELSEKVGRAEHVASGYAAVDYRDTADCFTEGNANFPAIPG